MNVNFSNFSPLESIPEDDEDKLFIELLDQAKIHFKDNSSNVSIKTIMEKMNVNFMVARKIQIALKKDVRDKRIIEIQKMKIQPKEL